MTKEKETANDTLKNVTTTPKVKAKNNEPKPESAGTKEHFNDLAATSKKNKSEGRENVKIDLVKTVTARFTEDFGLLKKGHVQSLSQTAYDIYNKKGVVELVG